jgi:hypothetical protein
MRCDDELAVANGSGFDAWAVHRCCHCTGGWWGCATIRCDGDCVTGDEGGDRGGEEEVLALVRLRDWCNSRLVARLGLSRAEVEYEVGLIIEMGRRSVYALRMTRTSAREGPMRVSLCTKHAPTHTLPLPRCRLVFSTRQTPGLGSTGRASPSLSLPSAFTVFVALGYKCRHLFSTSRCWWWWWLGLHDLSRSSLRLSWRRLWYTSPSSRVLVVRAALLSRQSVETQLFLVG